MATIIKNVIVTGASGNIGVPIVDSLLKHGFAVSVLTRQSSDATFRPEVKVYRTDYSRESLLKAFKGQDAVIAAVNASQVQQQKVIIEAAISAGVKRYLPSEYGIDSAVKDVGKLVPVAGFKQEIIDFLRTKESRNFSWSAIVVGSFFDWTFQIPGFLGWNVPQQQATIYDGGNTEYEVTNVAQIARAVTASLTDKHFEETRNAYVYINSFTVTQNQVLASLEQFTGAKFEVHHEKIADIVEEGLREYNGPSEGIAGLKLITAAIYNSGGFNNYSRTRELWNDRLGLPKESLDESLASALKAAVVGA